MSPLSEDDIELYRNITSKPTFPCICCLHHRHNAFTRSLLYSLSNDSFFNSFVINGVVVMIIITINYCYNYNNK